MNAPPVIKRVRIPTPEGTLRKLYLLLFLRGRSSRGLNRGRTPKSLTAKLGLSLVFYCLMGVATVRFLKGDLFSMSIYVHALTLAFLGMFVAGSAGEVLFNKDEGDILLHRPVTPQELLKAKLAVMLMVSLMLALALNLASLVIGVATQNGNWTFPAVHIVSVAMEAVFCVSAVTLTYQLCLRWFGRERLDGLMTSIQVIVTVGVVVLAQVIPRMMFRYGSQMNLDPGQWWLICVPPAWFAGLDDALAGSGGGSAWQLALAGIVVTAVITWLAFSKFAKEYGAGLQRLNEGGSVAPTRNQKSRGAWLQTVADTPPMNWVMRDSVARAGFVLAAGYLFRDRDTKLRVYPGIAPILILPVVLLLQGGGGFNFILALTGGYIGLLPCLAISLLQYSQQWQAADIFRVAPVHGPAGICHGAKWAVLVFLTLPVLLAFAGLVYYLAQHHDCNPWMVLPGLMILPLYASLPSWRGVMPLSKPTEEAKSAGRGLIMMLAIFLAMGLGGIALLCDHYGYFWWFVLGEAIVAGTVYWLMDIRLKALPWPSLE